MLTKSPVVCFLMLGITGGALAQNNAGSPDMQKIMERLDRLESENQKLLDEVRQLRTELQSTRTETPAAAAEPAAPVPDSERIGVLENRTADLDQSKVSSSQRFPVSLTGMLLFNAFMNGKSGGGAEFPVVAGAPTAATDGATVRQTILGLKFNGPDLPGGGKASGSIYMDFYGGTLLPYNNLFRIRTAALDLRWKNTTLTVGQDKPLISPREPTSFAQVGISPLTGAGNLWDWNPQARIEQRFSLGESTGLKAQAAVYETNENYGTALPASYAGTLERSRPAYQGRFEFFHGDDRRRFEVAPGFSLSATRVVGQSVSSRIASIDWLIRPVPFLEFSGEAYNGHNVGGFGALPGFNILPGGRAIPIHSHGEWGQISLFPLPRLSAHMYAGEQFNRASEIAPYAAQRNFTFAGNIMYKIAPNVMAALEAAQTRTQYLGSLLRLNNHYDLALAYLF
jgi:hypothetical protein